MNELELSMSKDDISGLESLFASEPSPDMLMETKERDLPIMLKDNPPLISFAAYYGSINCVRFLLLNNASIFVHDEVHFLFIRKFIFVFSISNPFRGSWWLNGNDSCFYEFRC